MDNKKLLTIGSAYALVVLIWSTTPLTIKWSGQGVNFLFGVTARMTIGTLLAALLTIWQYGALSYDKKALQVYLSVGLAIFFSESVIISSHCAIHPAMRGMANITGNMSVGMLNA